MLKDSKPPANRVLRKTAVTTFALAIWVSIWRHTTLGLGFGAPALVTLIIVLLLYCLIAIIGGTFAGGLYDLFLRSVDAKNIRPSIITFFVEWLFALAFPLTAVLMYLLNNSDL